MSKSISAKELRENLGKYLSEVEKGKSFTLIYRSRIIGELTPTKSVTNSHTSEINIFTGDHPEFKKWKPKRSAVELIRRERD